MFSGVYMDWSNEREKNRRAPDLWVSGSRRARKSIQPGARSFLSPSPISGETQRSFSPFV